MRPTIAALGLLLLALLATGCLDFDKLDRCFEQPCPDAGPQQLSEEFSAGALDPAWVFMNPAGGSYALGNDHLRLTAPGGAEHECWGATLSCVRLVRPVQGGDATYEAKLDDLALAWRYQSAGIFLYRDPSNFARFELLSDGEGLSAIAITTVDGASAIAIPAQPLAVGASVYLQVRHQGSGFTLHFSHDGADWREVGSFSSGFSPRQAGLHVSNSDANAETSASVDRFTMDSD